MPPKAGYTRYTVHLGARAKLGTAPAGWRLERMFGSGFRRLDARMCRHNRRPMVHVRDPHSQRRSIWITPGEWDALGAKEVS